MTIQVLNGANLGRLGSREPRDLRDDDLRRARGADRDRGRRARARRRVRQTDAEAELLGWVHDAADAGDAVVINPGGWSHTSVVLRDALAALTGAAGRGAPHQHPRAARSSGTTPTSPAVADGVIAGLGVAATSWRCGTWPAGACDDRARRGGATGCGPRRRGRAGRRPGHRPGQRPLPDRVHRLQRRAAACAPTATDRVRHRRPLHHPGRHARCPTWSCWSTAAPAGAGRAAAVTRRRRPARASSPTTSPSTACAR